MDADEWYDELQLWVEELLARIESDDDSIRLSDAAAELRASRFSADLKDHGDGDLANLINETVDLFERFGVLGERDPKQGIVDPSNAWVKTSASILHRRKLSHRISAENVADRILPFDAMLGALAADIPGFDSLYDGRGEPLERRPTGRSASDSRGVAVPDWVDGFDEGRLAVIWREGQTLHFDVVDDGDLEADGSCELGALLAWVELGAAHGLGRELTMGVFDLMHHDAESFTRTTPPMDELLLANGLGERRGWWGRADSEWQTPGEQVRAGKLATVVQRYGLQHRAEQALARLDDIWRGWSGFHLFEIGDRPDIDVAEIRDLLEIELVPLAFFDLHGSESAIIIGGRKDPRGEKTPLNLLADKVAQEAPDSAAALLLTARNHEVFGRARASDLAYREALRRYESNVTALAKCMEAAVDASRFDEALRLTKRLMGPGSRNESTLQSYVDVMMSAGRNEPCPCGSGRKYKQCHQGIPLLPEPYATRSLIFKLEMFAERMALVDQFAPGDRHRLAVELIGYPEARDFVIHEGGMLRRFIETRVELIPPDELERLRSWQIGERCLYEITDVDPGHGMTLRNVGTGEHTEMLERMGSASTQIGEYVLLRLETIDGVTRSYGQGMLVPASQRNRVLDLLDESEPDGLLEWFADSLAPPELTTSDGDALVFCTAVISAVGPVRYLRALLDDEFGKGMPQTGPPKDREWTAIGDGEAGEGSIDQDSSVLATIRIVDKCVELSTMSAARHQHFVDVLLEILPDAEVVDESFEPVDLAAVASHAAELAEIDGGLIDDEDMSEEMQAFMDEHILKMEANWLNESIPALGGLTPFEALDDPTRRPDLIRLLNTMPPGPNTFNADRLRAALGLASS